MFSLSKEYSLAPDESMMWDKLEEDIERVAQEIADAGISAPDVLVFNDVVHGLVKALREVNKTSFSREDSRGALI